MRTLAMPIVLSILIPWHSGFAQEPPRASVYTLRTCNASFYPPGIEPAHPPGETPFHVTAMYMPQGRVVEVRGCNNNHDFHFVRNLGDVESYDVYTIPMVTAGRDDLLIMTGDSEYGQYEVHSADNGFAEIFSVRFWGDERLEDVDGDGKFELMLQKIIRATCANGRVPSLVYDSEEFQTIDADIVCGR